MAGHGGGAWKVAYADFVTAMMAFFMVMWLVSQNEDVKNEVAQYFRDPFAIETDDPPSRGYGSERHPPKKDGRFSPVIERRHEGRGQPGKMRNGFAAAQFNDAPQITVLFKNNTIELDEDQLRHLQHSVENLLGRRNRIEIRAHSLGSPLPPDSPYKNQWELCYARTSVIRDKLEAMGIDADLIRMSQASGNEPIALSLDKSELEFNSRVDVHVLPEIVDSHAGAGDYAKRIDRQR